MIDQNSPDSHASPNSEYLLQNLRNLLSDETYGYATTVVTYCETKSLSFNYIGMAEFRDALTHIGRAINETDETKMSNEFSSAFEHIRRAAVESMQEYVELKYANVKKRLLVSDFKYFVSRYKKPQKDDIIKSEEIIKTNLVLGRTAKPKKEWQIAIGYFKKAEDELDKLDAQLPTVKEIQDRYSNTLFVILLAILVLFMILTIR